MSAFQVSTLSSITRVEGDPGVLGHGRAAPAAPRVQAGRLSPGSQCHRVLGPAPSPMGGGVGDKGRPDLPPAALSQPRLGGPRRPTGAGRQAGTL